MPGLVTPADPADRAGLLRWVEQRLPDARFDDATALPAGVVVGGELLAVAVYHSRREASVEMAIASTSPRWATKGTIAQLLAPPFTILGCRRITAIAHSDNTHSQHFLARLGFQFEGVLSDAFKDGDAVIFGMTRTRWESSAWHDEPELQEAA